MFAHDLHLARLSIDDLSGIADDWRARAEGPGRDGSVARSIADAMQSVVSARQSAAAARRGLKAAWAPLARAADWAASRR